MAGKIVVKIVVGAFCQFNETILLKVHDLFNSHEAILNSQEQKYGCVGAFCEFNETILLKVHDLFSSQEAILNSQEQKYGCVGAFC
jgi:exosome complex RNA-binding protein Rrp4